jgi:hypothetical protein
MGSRKLLVSLIAILLLVAGSLSAQDVGKVDALDEALRELSDKAMGVHITARITQGSEQTVWDMDVTRVTISGRAVTLRLDGSNVTVVAKFTPYRDNDDSILLVAQGQTWISQNGGSRDIDYQTAFESMPIQLGEPVVFLPLGSNELTMDVETGSSATFNIELEVTIVPYEGQTAEE